MIIKASVLTILLIVFVFISFATFVSVVIGLFKRSKKLWATSLVIFLISTCLFSLTITYVGKKAFDRAYITAQTIPEKIDHATKNMEGLVNEAYATEGIAEAIVEGAVKGVWADDRSYLLDNDIPSPQIELIKSYVPETVLANVNPDYYTYFGFRDWWRFPLVYPYSIHTIDTIEDGYLMNERGVKDFQNGIEKAYEVGVNGITHLTFDQNYLLLKTYDSGQSRYIIFSFETGRVVSRMIETEEELFEKARELNFEGEMKLISLIEYDSLF